MQRLKIRELGPRSRKISTVIKIVKKLNEKDVISRTDGLKHKISEFLVGDESGCIIMSLWDSLIDEVMEGSVYEVRNCYIHLFNSSMRLNLGRIASIKQIEKVLGVNTENNLSEKKIEIPGGKLISELNQPSWG